MKKAKTLIVHLSSLPIKDMRYKTLGDWEKGELDEETTVFKITTAKTGKQDYDFLILLHELIEAYLCHKHGVSGEAVDAFDTDNLELDDPGLDPKAPYYDEHAAALEIEAKMSVELGVDWTTYEDAQLKVLQKYGHNTQRRKANLLEHAVSRRTLGKKRKNS